MGLLGRWQERKRMKPLAQCLDITDSQYTVIVPSIKVKGGTQQPRKSGCTSSSPSASPRPQPPTCTPPSTKEPTVLPSPPTTAQFLADMPAWGQGSQLSQGAGCEDRTGPS